MLLVKIISLNSKVKDQDWFSKNDLYIELVYGDQIHRTTVKWNNDNPKWNETFLFDYVENQKMKFELYDQNVWSPGKKLVHLHRFVPEMGEIKYTTQGIFNIQIGNVKHSEMLQVESLEQKLKRISIEKRKAEQKLEQIINILK